MRRILTLSLIVLIAPVLYAQRRRAAIVTPFPPCSLIEGTPAVTFTRNEGATLTPIEQPLQGTAYTYGLAALDVPRMFLSFHGNTLSVSSDDGCHWRAVGSYSAEFPPSIAAANGGRAYVWSDNRQFLLRYDNGVVTTLKAPGAIVGIAADAHDGLHVRVGTGDGSIAESFDGGATWRGLAFPPASQVTYYRMAFDPNDLDHVVAGASVAGAFVSWDGGRNWTRATGFATPSVNAFNVAISPVDGNVVWLAAIELTAGESPRHIFMSRDGGQSYVAVVGDGGDVTIVNQPIMAANPANPEVMYFVFGTYFQGYGTDIYRYDASTETLTKTHNGYNDVNSIAFYPGRADIMYLGLEVEQVR
jgi:hypothetical protein